MIFILDSQYNRLSQNIKSWNELISLFGESIYHLPIIFSLNKYDLENTRKITEQEIFSELNLSKLKNYTFIKSEAIKGKGIIESFEKIINLIFPNLLLNLNSIRA
ncbi:MAG: ADP-ribosylation factor-like protein [Promethearchaeota archaeon]